MEFYRQGATVSSTVTINSGASATVHVYDPGRLQVSPTPDTVVAGVGGPSLTVTALGVDDDPTRITVHNGTASAVTINAGTRLIPTTSRPTAYRDPSGAVGLGSSITADGDGRATCYVDEKRFDYTVPGDPVIFDRDSSQTLTGSYDTMTWEHTAGDTDPLLAGGADRLVLVAISWQDSLAEESITSVTYGGIAMTRVALRGLVELYSLLNPPTGSQNIVVTWDGTNPKGAVSSALSLSHVDRSSPLGAPVGNNQGGSTLISVTVPETDPCGMVVDAVAVKAGSSLTTFTPGAAQVTRWYDHAGTSGDGTLIQGAGSTRAGSGGSVTMSWTLVAPKSWWAVAVQVNAAPSRLVVDAEGADLARAPIVLNAADYPTIQAAIDACPKGGAVYIPTGDWSLSVHGENGTLKVRQSLHKDGLTIFGDGWGTKLVQSDPATDCIVIQRTDPPAAMGNFTIRDLRIEGTGDPEAVDPPGTGRHIFLDAVGSVTIQKVIFWGSQVQALEAHDVSYLSCIDCQFGNGGGSAILVHDSYQAYFLRCTALGFRDRLFKGDGGGGYVIIGGEYSAGHVLQIDKHAADAFIEFEDCGGVVFIRPAMENYSQYTTKTAIRFSGCNDGVVVGGGMTVDHLEDIDGSMGIALSNCHGFEIGMNAWVNTQTAVSIDDDCSHVFVAQQHQVSGSDSSTLVSIPHYGSDRAAKYIVVIGAQGIIPPAFAEEDEPGHTASTEPPEGALWYRVDGEHRGWWGWDGALRQLGGD